LIDGFTQIYPFLVEFIPLTLRLKIGAPHTH
jgi:hypothetical protein